MSLIHIVLLVGAVICFFLATIGVTSRVNLVALGLMLWVLSVILAGLPPK